MHQGIKGPKRFAALRRSPDDYQPFARDEVLDEVIRHRRPWYLAEASQLEAAAVWLRGSRPSFERLRDIRLAQAIFLHRGGLIDCAELRLRRLFHVRRHHACTMSFRSSPATGDLTPTHWLPAARHRAATFSNAACPAGSW